MSRESQAGPVRRILVRGPNWLGDAVMATPGLRALRRAHPDARIIVQLPESLVPLLAGSGLADEVWSLASRTGGLTGWRDDIRRIRAGAFDLGIAIPESVSSALLMRLGRVRVVTGFARDVLRRALLHRVVPAPADWGRRRLVSREQFVMALMASVGATSEDLRPVLRVTGEERTHLETALANVGSSLAALRARPPVVVAPGAGFGPSKRWPVERYAALADRLAEEGEEILLLGAPGEGEVVQSVERSMRAPAIVLDGVLHVGALKALLAEARAVVANDAGARHVAAAFGVPGVVFFGPTSVAKTADNLEGMEVLETEHACRPCYRRRCPIDHRCLRSIDVERAAAALGRVLEGARRDRPRPIRGRVA